MEDLSQLPKPRPGETQTFHSDTGDVTRKGPKLDLDVRGLLAIMAMVGGFALGFLIQIQTGKADIPAWAAAVVTGVVGFYFGGKGSSNGNGK